MPIKLKKWLSGIWKGISKLWNKAEDEIKRLVPVAIGVVQNVKKFVDSPVADVITALIPGDIDDKIKERLRAELPKLIINMQLVGAIADIEDTEEQLKAILAKLKLSSDAAQNVFYHGLASLIIEILADKKVTWSEAVILSEYYYRHFEKQAA